jgi:hypothetical protein
MASAEYRGTASLPVVWRSAQIDNENDDDDEDDFGELGIDQEMKLFR